MKFTGERFIPQNNEDAEIYIEHYHRYLAAKPLVKDKVVLDAACGAGYGSFILSSEAKMVIGVDISEEAILHAKEQYKRDNLTYLMNSIEEIEVEDHSIDVVISFETIEHVEEELQHKFLKEIKRVLKKDGILIMSTPDREVYSQLVHYSNEYHVKEFAKIEYKQFLHLYFENIQFFTQGFKVASVINGDTSPNILKNINEARVDDDYSIDEKYLIAICSEKQESLEDIDFNSIVIESGKKYNNQIRRILDLQEEVEERNAHLKYLDKQIDEFTTALSNKELEIKELMQKYTSLDEESRKASQEFQMVVERLNHVEQSLSWRLVSKCNRIIDKLIPFNSKRRLIVSLGIRFMKEPKIFLKSVNKSSIKSFFTMLGQYDANSVLGQVDIALNSQEELSRVDIKLVDCEEKEKIIFEKFENPTVSIIIPVYNQFDYTYSCLKAIKENTKNVTYEIIIGDDVSNDETVNIFDYAENIKVNRHEKNTGFLMNCNDAAQVAIGKYVLFLNNDTNVQEDWLEPLVSLIESDEKIGMVGSKLVYLNGKLQEAGGIIWDDASGWNYGRLDDPNKPEYNYVKEVDYISGACIMLSMKLWKEIGGFDQRFIPAYYEDTDLAFEVRKRGLKVVYQPKSMVVHFEGISNGTDLNSGLKKYQVVNLEKFKEKWAKELKENHFPNAQNVFLAKDRSADKKRILVVDHYVPHYDQDAGGKCTYHYLKLFTKLGYKVTFIGDNFFKHEPYTGLLQQMGIEVLYGNWYYHSINEWLKLNAKYFDFVYMNRPHITEKYIDLIKQYSNAKIIYFGHDLHYLREQRNYEVTGEESLLESSANWKQKEFNLFNKSDIIHVVGNYEQSLIQKEMPNKIVRNIPLYIYDEFFKNKNGFKDRKDILFVGGFRHKPNEDAVLWFMNEIWPFVAKQNPQMKFYIVGSNPSEQIKALHSERVIVTGFISDEELETLYTSCRLVVAPLRYGAGVKGKIVEAIYYQIPVVTTSIGAEGLVDAEQVMIVENNYEKFAAKICTLYDDEINWNYFSEQEAKYICKHFSENAAISIINKDFN
ncbi:glycosyltransferase [Turicibacter sanguinis]|uniref:glycosyltransferase n=1 Tax=Turicibacter sanguinis TaxID=154288 RepID=UPI0023301F04|nr:glycosyltransferase [Turicibacter sanguinis]MDB8545132.1 glycosyltransferase [Turicibacter sanguinis]